MCIDIDWNQFQTLTQDSSIFTRGQETHLNPDKEKLHQLILNHTYFTENEIKQQNTHLQFHPQWAILKNNL